MAAPSTKCRVSFVIDRARLALISDVLIGEATDMHVDEFSSNKTKSSSRSTRWAEGSKKAVLAFMQQDPQKEYWYKDLGPAIEPRHSRNTISSVIAVLVDEGKIVKTSPGRYRLT